jgi:hypothetical protein
MFDTTSAVALTTPSCLTSEAVLEVDVVVTARYCNAQGQGQAPAANREEDEVQRVD